MAGKWHSKLNAHREAIRRWRKAGKTYREISLLLWEEKGVRAHPDTVNSFVLARFRAARRGRAVAELPEEEERGERGAPSPSAVSPPRSFVPPSSRTSPPPPPPVPGAEDFEAAAGEDLTGPAAGAPFNPWGA